VYPFDVLPSKCMWVHIYTDSCVVYARGCTCYIVTTTCVMAPSVCSHGCFGAASGLCVFVNCGPCADMDALVEDLVRAV